MESTTGLSRLQQSVQRLHLDGTELDSVTKEVLQYIHDFWSHLPQYKTYEKDTGSSERIFKEKIASGGRPLKEILDVFHVSVTRTGIQEPSGGHFGYIPSGGLPLSAFADFIAAAVNKYVGVYTSSPGGVNMENYLLEWAAGLFGYDLATSGGNLCSGGSIGGLMCVAAARDKRGIKGEDYRSAVVYASAHTHFFLDKALKFIGMSDCVIRKISVDAGYSIDTLILEETLENDTKTGLNPFLIIGSLGTTSTGSVDDINQLAALARKFNCWFHVDAAYGGFFVLLEEMKELFNGVEQADSIMLDPHKSLFIPYGSGIVLVKDRKDLLRTCSYDSVLIDNSDNQQQSPADLSLELTRNFRGLRLWLPLMYYGVDVFIDALREKLLLTKYAYDKMKELKFIELGPPPQLTVFIFRYNGLGMRNNGCNTVDAVNEFNKHMMQIFYDDGRAFITDTVIDGVVWMRVAVLCFRTHKKEVDSLIDMLKVNFEEHHKLN